MLKKEGNEVWGIEFSNSSGKLARKRIDNVLIQDAELKWELPSNYFDIVTFIRYLEHVFDYNFQLKEARRTLKEDGILIIFSPNMSILERIRLMLGIKPLYSEHIEHIRQFTLPYLLDILKKNGFEPMYCKGWGLKIPKTNLRINLIEKTNPNLCSVLTIKSKKIN